MPDRSHVFQPLTRGRHELIATCVKVCAKPFTVLRLAVKFVYPEWAGVGWHERR
jgi:hypothetical protein